MSDTCFKCGQPVNPKDPAIRYQEPARVAHWVCPRIEPAPDDRWARHGGTAA